MIYQAQQ